jgi:hypothetical protein
MIDKYFNSYRVLGIDHHATWSEVTVSYRRLIHRWHPDRHQQDASARAIAETRTQEIIAAYRILATYYKRHGNLPLNVPPDTIATAAGASNAMPADATIFAEPPLRPAAQGPDIANTQEPQPSHFKQPVAWSAVIAIAGYVLWALVLHEPNDPRANRSTPTLPDDHESAQTERRRSDDKYFTVGSTLAEVYDAQGTPSRVENDVWHYGASKIYFSKGSVVRWESAPGNPLNARWFVEPQHMVPGFFTYGSTKDHVRSVQGNPLRESDSVWDYGLSKIYFRRDRVTGWEESPLDPLRARK